MARPRVSVPPEAIRIEDEVWEDAFTRREPAASRRLGRLQAIEGGRLATAAVGTAAGPSRKPAAVPPVPADTAPEVPVGSPRAAGAPVRAAALGVTEPVVTPRPSAREAGTALPGRRTVTIRGRGAERNRWPETPRRRPPRRAYERAGFKPDRVALWAVFLGLLLLLVAIASAHG